MGDPLTGEPFTFSATLAGPLLAGGALIGVEGLPAGLGVTLGLLGGDPLGEAGGLEVVAKLRVLLARIAENWGNADVNGVTVLRRDRAPTKDIILGN